MIVLVNRGDHTLRTQCGTTIREVNSRFFSISPTIVKLLFRVVHSPPQTALVDTPEHLPHLPGAKGIS